MTGIAGGWLYFCGRNIARMPILPKVRIEFLFLRGLLIWPESLSRHTLDDYNRLDCNTIRDIYREVSLPEDMMNIIMNEL